MQNRTNQILLAVCIVTAAAYVFILLSWLEIIPSCRPADDPFRYAVLHAWLALCFHLIPFFCLQLLLCRTVKRMLGRLLPLLLVAALAAVLGLCFVSAAGWDALGWGILLLLCVAPAAGCGLGWGVYGVRKLAQFVNR